MLVKGLIQKISSKDGIPPALLQLIRFLIAGATGYLLNLASFYLFNIFANVFLAAVMAFIVSATYNFYLNRWWTFQATESKTTGQAIRFLFVNLISVGTNLFVLYLLVPHLNDLPSQAIAIALVTPVNFLGNKYWTFRKGRQ